MLTYGHLAMMTAFISMFCVFVTAPHSCGAYFFAPLRVRHSIKGLTRQY